MNLHLRTLVVTADETGLFGPVPPNLDALVGGKMDLTEGGIRVPWIAHLPAVILPVQPAVNTA